MNLLKLRDLVSYDKITTLWETNIYPDGITL